MQARPKIVKIFVVALIVSLVLVACGGGSTGSTWFNLPSVKVRVQPDGAMKVWGFTVSYFPDPTLLQQLQAANIQELEIRIGYNGIHAYANGEDLPYIAWDEADVNTLQAILPRLPNVPNAETIAAALPWLRTIGLGVLLDLPLAQGTTELNVPNWNGETAITPATEPPAVGPITIGSLTFDPQGQAFIEGVPVSTLEQALGMPLGIALPPDILALLQNLGAEAIQVHITPNGIDLGLGNQSLPSIAWDTARVDSLTKYLPAFVADPALLGTIDQALPLLTSADIQLAVSLTGEQAVETELAPIELGLTPDGGLELFGIPMMPGTVPADVINNLQAANVQHLAVSLQNTGLYLAANGQTLPTITWTDTSLDTVVQVAGVLMGNEALLRSVVDIATGIGPNLRVSVPPAEGAAAVEVPQEIDFAITPTEANPQAPTLRLELAVDSAGNVTTLGPVDANELSQLGVTLPTLPADTVARLTEAGIQQVQVDTEPGVLNVIFDGGNVLAINYDQPSLTTTLDLAAPFLGDTPLSDPLVSQLVREQVMPLVPQANVDLTFDLP